MTATEIDHYWARQAALAYEERLLSVRDALRMNGGRLEPWMRFQVARRDLDAELEKARA